MQPEDRIRLRHLREAAAKALTYSEGNERSDLHDGRPTVRADALRGLADDVDVPAPPESVDYECARLGLPRPTARAPDALDLNHASGMTIGVCRKH